MDSWMTEKPTDNLTVFELTTPKPMEDSDIRGQDVVYGIFLPIVCVFGLFGNILSFFLLTRKRFRTDNIMYAYMTGLAVVDATFLCCTLLRCHYNLIQNINIDSCSLDAHTVNMDVNVVPSLTTMFGTTSDLVIAFMTINRYHLIKSLDEHRVVHLKKWVGYFEVLTALLICCGCSVPYFFQHDVINRKDPADVEDCWTYRRSEVTKTFGWTFFTLILQTLLRIVPSFGISILNIHMYKKLKCILRERRDAREKRIKIGQKNPTPLNLTYGTLVADVVVATNQLSCISEALHFRRKSSGSESGSRRHRKRHRDGATQEKCVTLKIKRIRIRPKSMMLKMFHPRTKTRHSKELRSTSILLWVVITHFVLATPGNILFFVCAAFSSNQFQHDGDGSVFPSFNDQIMNARPWLAAFTYFAHILFVLKYAINYLLYFATNKVVREETVKLLFRCKNLYWYRFRTPGFAPI